jgi:hypothetical protein
MACCMMMAWLAVGSVAVVSTSTASPVMAAINAGLCTDADSACAQVVSRAPSTAEPADAEVWLLQLAAARADATRMKSLGREHGAEQEEEGTMAHRKGINMSSVWEKIKVVARVDKLKTAIRALSNSNITKKMQENLKQVLSSLPPVEQVKEHFADHWENVSRIADMEVLQSNLLEVESDSAEAGELYQQLQDLQAQSLSNTTVEDMRNQVANTWGELQGKGFSFPNLDSFTAHAEDMVKKFIRTVKNSTLADGAQEAVHGLVEEIKTRASHGVPQEGAGSDSMAWAFDRRHGAVDSSQPTEMRP